MYNHDDAFQPPHSGTKRRGKAGDGDQRQQAMAGCRRLQCGAWVQAEKMMQIALMLPCGRVHWLAGRLGLDQLAAPEMDRACRDRLRRIISGLVRRHPHGDVACSRSQNRADENGDGDRKAEVPATDHERQKSHHPFADLTDADLEALLRRAIRITLIMGAVPRSWCG